MAYLLRTVRRPKNTAPSALASLLATTWEEENPTDSKHQFIVVKDEECVAREKVASSSSTPLKQGILTLGGKRKLEDNLVVKKECKLAAVCAGKPEKVGAQCHNSGNRRRPRSGDISQQLNGNAPTRPIKRAIINNRRYKGTGLESPYEDVSSEAESLELPPNPSRSSYQKLLKKHRDKHSDSQWLTDDTYKHDKLAKYERLSKLLRIMDLADEAENTGKVATREWLAKQLEVEVGDVSVVRMRRCKVGNCVCKLCATVIVISVCPFTQLPQIQKDGCLDLVQHRRSVNRTKALNILRDYERNPSVKYCELAKKYNTYRAFVSDVVCGRSKLIAYELSNRQ